jgi:hypothetical protein
MDTAKAIETNLIALRRVVEEIFALLELVLDGTVTRLPHVLYVAANRLLVPAEGALRRLIVLAARGLKVQPPRPRAKAPGTHIVARGTRPLSFQLYDTRKRFDPAPQVQSKNNGPRIHFFADMPLVARFFPQRKKQFTALRLCRRFAAFKLALENIPHQAKRLAAWRARREEMAQAKFRFPLRPGAPPGWHRKPTLKIDHILNECHRLAMQLQREAPS